MSPLYYTHFCRRVEEEGGREGESESTSLAAPDAGQLLNELTTFYDACVYTHSFVVAQYCWMRLVKLSISLHFCCQVLYTHVHVHIEQMSHF